MHNRDDESLLAPRLEDLAAATSSSAIAATTVITADSETESQVPCWRGAKACFCTLRRYLLVAICDILIITVLCVSLVEPRWLMIRQGRCVVNGGEGRYIGIDFFFSRGLYVETPSEIVFRYGENNEMVNCLNAAAVTIFRCAVTLIICCICLTLVSFFFCIVKLRIQLFLIIRKYAVFNIVTAIISAAVLVLIFCASDEVDNIQQKPTKVHNNMDPATLTNPEYISTDPYAITDFSTGYYMILLAAFLSLLAVGITLIDCACYHQVFTSSRHSSRGYERLVTSASSSVPISDERLPSSNMSSSRDPGNRTILVGHVSSTRSSRTFLAAAESTSGSLLPPPPPYAPILQPSARIGPPDTTSATATTATSLPAPQG